MRMLYVYLLFYVFNQMHVTKAHIGKTCVGRNRKAIKSHGKIMRVINTA